MSPRWFGVVAGLLLICSGVSQAFAHREKALWIDVKKHGHHETTIAVTEQIVRELLECDEVHFAKKGGKDPITKEMLRAVLDGEQESIETQNEDGSELTLHMAHLEVPAREANQEKLVLEVRKAGSRTLRVTIPEIDVEASNEEEDGVGSIETSIGWKWLLPFLAKEGGAIYVNSDEDETEIWMYVE